MGLILSRTSKEKFDIKYDTVIEVLIGSMIFGIIGARIYYVLFNLPKYIASPEKIFALRDGGLAIYGGIIAITLFLIVFCKLRKQDFWNLTDYLIPYLALGQCIGRWGNFFNVEAYGKTTTFFLRMGIINKLGYIEVHPVFLYESIATFCIFIILRLMQKNRKFKGQIFFAYFILYGAVRAILEGLRVDSLWLGAFRISQILSIIFLIISLICYIGSMTKKEKNVEK